MELLLDLIREDTVCGRDGWFMRRMAAPGGVGDVAEEGFFVELLTGKENRSSGAELSGVCNVGVKEDSNRRGASSFDKR